MNEPPEEIYLQFYDDDTLEPAEEVTWCVDKIGERDVGYIRKDRYLWLGEAFEHSHKLNAELHKENMALREQLEAANGTAHVD